MPDTLIDLHTHTTASDGELSPRDLVTYAYKLGLSAVAITDHDTVDGLADAVSTGNELGIDVITGVELSVNYESGSLHMLGYGLDYNNKALNDTLVKLKFSRVDRNGKIIELLETLGYYISQADVTRFAGNGTVGRSHIGLALIEAGYFSTIQETFDKLLTRGGPGYVGRRRLDLRDAIDLIHGAGGVCVWAHPGLHEGELDGMLELLPGWVRFGLDGVESDYSQHDIALRDKLRTLANKLNIIYTGGSDFHGAAKPDIKLGNGPAGERIDLSCLSALKARLSLKVS